MLSSVRIVLLAKSRLTVSGPDVIFYNIGARLKVAEHYVENEEAAFCSHNSHFLGPLTVSFYWILLIKATEQIFNY